MRYLADKIMIMSNNIIITHNFVRTCPIPVTIQEPKTFLLSKYSLFRALDIALTANGFVKDPKSGFY